MRRRPLGLLCIVLLCAVAHADGPPTTTKDTAVSLSYVETSLPRIASGGGITGAIRRVTALMTAQLRQSTAVLETSFRGTLKRPDRASDPWVMRIELQRADLRLGSGLSAEAADQARVDADTVRERLRGWRRELDESEVHCLLTSGGLSCTVASPFRSLGVLRGGPGIVNVHYSTVDISGDWQIVDEPQAILTIAQNAGRIDATWKALPKQAAAFAPPTQGMDLPVAPVRFQPRPPQDHRKVGGPALRGVLSKRNLEATFWLAQTAETGSVDLELMPQGDLLEGIVWTPQPVDADRAGSPFRSGRFALRRVRASREDVEVRFVAKTQRGYFYDIDAIPYAEPFWIEVRYRTRESTLGPMANVSWTDGEQHRVPVFEVRGESNVYRSPPLHAEQAPPPRGAGGSGR